MNVMIYLPKLTPEKEELEKKVASIHAQAVTSRLKQMPCPSGQKEALFAFIQDSAMQL